MPSLPDLIQGCIDRDPQLMEQFYYRFAPEMWVVCLRYTRNMMMAEDVMQEGFIRVFEQIRQFSGKGSLEGWLRRIFITTAINHYRKYHRFDKQEREIDTVFDLADTQVGDVIGSMEADQLLTMLDALPPGYKLVFNLYAIEGYSHKEIAEMLGCSEGNSKSQLARARIYLQRMIAKLSGNKTNTRIETYQK